ncbi:hypothetical protein GCM10011487_10890 [Steroidobacter agaridevorans]|uniref:Uncharacterized protein n=1 Tax=Steroidobacter agaridevorans TaxID=2695856 RepID=A0A829Y769_9GAMM|nr:hypothetical protein [Steroidobacter agaridevorans]GFE79089.1 hypothetical protein GCM10011487_10890 [Steroidobacter agaridevorans]
MFDEDKKDLIKAVAVLACCLVALTFIGERTPTGVKISGVLGNVVAMIAAGAAFVAFKAGASMFKDYKNRSKSAEESAAEEHALRARIIRARWFVGAAAIFVAFFLVSSVPALVKLSGLSFDMETSGRILFAAIFFLPLSGLIVMMPLVSSLNRSVLGWGLAFVLVPFGSLIVGGILLHLAHEEWALRRKWAAAL